LKFSIWIRFIGIPAPYVIVTFRQKEGIGQGKNPSDNVNGVIEDHHAVIEICEETDPDEVRDKEHTPVRREPEYLDDGRQEGCPESDDAHEGKEEGMEAEECKGPDQGKQELQDEQDQPEGDFMLLDTGLKDKEENESHEDEGCNPER
jgi:hypothetical protein